MQGRERENRENNERERQRFRELDRILRKKERLDEMERKI